jgi:hypothetical protein
MSRFRAFTRFDCLFVALSIAFAIALLIAFRLREDSKVTALRKLTRFATTLRGAKVAEGS